MSSPPKMLGNKMISLVFALEKIDDADSDDFNRHNAFAFWMQLKKIHRLLAVDFGAHGRVHVQYMDMPARSK